MSEFENMDGWTEEEVDAYFGSADDPVDDVPNVTSAEIVDAWTGYDPATYGQDEGEVTA